MLVKGNNIARTRDNPAGTIYKLSLLKLLCINESKELQAQPSKLINRMFCDYKKFLEILVGGVEEVPRYSGRRLGRGLGLALPLKNCRGALRAPPQFLSASASPNPRPSRKV